MEIKLKRVFNLFRMESMMFLLIIVLFLSFSVISSDDKVVSCLSIIFAFVCFLSFIPMAYCKKMNIEKGKITYIKRVLRKKMSDSGFSIGVRRGNNTVKALHIVMDIEKIEFKQNMIEKIFNTGHIIFIGKTDIVHEDCVLLPRIEKHRIYGIPNFDGFCQELGEYIQCEGR